MASTSRHRLPRRRLAAGGAALLGLAGAGAAGTPADAASPDAELIANCAAFDALERQYLAADCDDEMDRLAGAQQPYLDAISVSRPTTLAGCRALANTLVSLDCEILEQYAARGYTADRLLLALLYGLTGRGGHAPANT